MESIHITHWGSSGSVVLMIHGGPQGGPAGGAQTFSRQEELVQRGWQLVLPDRPGHGKSPSRGPEDMEVDAVWVADLLGESSHLVGHSYGGCIALAAAARRPHAVKSLTLIEAPIFAAADDDAIVGKFRAQHAEIRSGNYSPIERLIKFGEMVNIPTALLASTGTAPTADELERMGEGIASMRLPTDWDAGPALKAVVDALTPVLAITGGWSPAFAAIADGIAAKTSGKHVVVQAGHHFPQLVDPFNEVLATFLTI